MSKFAELLFNLPVNKSFTYRNPFGDECTNGMRVKAPFRGRERTGYVLATKDDPPEGTFEIKEITRVLDNEPLFDDTLVSLGEWMSGMYMCSLGEAIAAMLPGGKREHLQDLYDEQTPVPDRFDLHSQQQKPLEEIISCQEGMFYLFGVTGSGKTEVYLRAAEHTLKEGRSVIYLVPEISLTHQVIEIVLQRFGDQVALLHSALTPSQRLSEWMRIRRGQARVVVGARSAVFAPLEDIGLIVIDEEHEGSYKSGRTPRYHARQVAMKRCALQKGRLIMGSATPSLEAYYLMQQGTLTAFTMEKRLSGGELPKIEIVDMRKEERPISRTLELQMRQVLNEGNQIILFLNRRGFSYFFHCHTCGYEMKCRHCSVSLTFHKKKNRMICHYCGFSSAPVQVCSDCGSLDVGYAGFGTEKIEQVVEALFPGRRIERVDADTASKKGALKHTLEQFKNREIDILLGTQMVAKGLNFPGVKLVGIVLADTGLQLPDFRASERTISLMIQVAGRSGRNMEDGKVIVQTLRPDNEAVRFAQKHDIQGFFTRELETRKQLMFPPYTRLFRVVFRGKDPVLTRNTAREFADELQKSLSGAGSILGPADCPIAVVSGNTRFQLILRTTSFSRSHTSLSRTASSFLPRKGIYIEIDVDPVALL